MFTKFSYISILGKTLICKCLDVYTCLNFGLNPGTLHWHLKKL